MRLALGPAGRVVPDMKASLPGRGVWIDPTTQNLQQLARMAPRVERVLGGSLDGAALLADLRTLVRAQALDRLGVATRMGALVFGHDALARALAARRVVAAVITADAVPRTRASIIESAAAGGVEVVSVPLSTAEVGAATGRGLLAVFGVAGSSLTATLIGVLRRLSDLG